MTQANQLTTRHGSTAVEVSDTRETKLAHYYSAERRAGADPLTANERMAEFAKRLDGGLAQ